MCDKLSTKVGGRVVIEPCEKCLDSEYERGKDDGRDE
jgi:hypothetical protein